MILMCLLLLFFISWKLSLLLLLCCLVIGIERLFCFRIHQKRRKDIRTKTKALQAISAEETVDGGDY